MNFRLSAMKTERIAKSYEIKWPTLVSLLSEYGWGDSAFQMCYCVMTFVATS